MFTGLVQSVGRVVGVEAAGSTSGQGITRFVIEPGKWAYKPRVGDSIAVNGCCLTLAEPVTKRRKGRERRERGGGVGWGERGGWVFEAVAQTMKVTNLGELRVGSRVNLERAVQASTLMGGHLVQGHVDGVGVVESIQSGTDWRVRIMPTDQGLMRSIVLKGSICVDGVSLTVAEVMRVGKKRGFEVALIPTTLAQTTLGELEKGSRVNLETDMIAKAVVNYLEQVRRGSRGRGKLGGAR